VNSHIQTRQTKPKLSKTLKKLFTLSLFAASIVSLNPATALGSNHQSAPDLFDDFDIQQATDKVLPPKAVKGKNHTVNVHTDLLGEDTLTLNLFDDVVVTAVRDRMIDNVKGQSTWIGHVEGEQDSEVYLTIHGNTMSGNVQIGDKTYEIEPNGNNQHDITQVDPDKNPKHSNSKTVEDFLAAGGQLGSTATPSGATTSAATASTVIDLMVVYTPRARTNAGGQAGIQTKIANAVAMANQAYINSKIDMQLNVVYVSEVNYTETGNMSDALTKLAVTNDGVIDEIHTWRNNYGADQVLMVTADANFCGIAYVMQSPSSAYSTLAFSATHDDSQYACLSDNTLAHELGHNQGDQHNREDANTVGAYSYSYGYRLCQTGGFRTVMSYSCSGGTRVSYFSSPNVALSNGLLTGTATENNALSMTNTKAIVAAFRTAVDTTLPAAPSNLTATASSNSAINLAWSDNSSNETGFRLERSADGVNWTEFALTASNITSYSDTGLVASTSYQYRVRAYNSNGNSSYSNIGTATTGAAVIDTTAPTVSILQPTGGAKVSGTVTISVNASDNVAVSQLKLYIDGNLVSSSNASSMSYNWNTRKANAGGHTISSQATDPSKNIGSTSVSVTK
jgi:peptidyl-Asp metalloendopeptidase